MKKLATKSRGTLLRLWQAVSFFPLRFRRLGVHLGDGLTWRFAKSGAELPASKTAQWWLELLFLQLDLLAVPEVYESVAEWLKWRTRPLTFAEIELARSVFGDTLDYRRIRIDEGARIACRDFHILYVSFFTINSWGHFRPDIFIHELAHVWQYQRLGAVYIPRALLAQRSVGGYNYGGAAALRKMRSEGRGLEAFNLEQQAEIVGDGFCLRAGILPRWTAPDPGDLPIFDFFLAQLQVEMPGKQQP